LATTFETSETVLKWRHATLFSRDAVRAHLGIGDTVGVCAATALMSIAAFVFVHARSQSNPPRATDGFVTINGVRLHYWVDASRARTVRQA
jgi:hypothetical protein